MAFMFADSFDFYPVSDSTAFTQYGTWTTVQASSVFAYSTTTRFTYGKSCRLVISSTTGAAKTGLSNSSNTVFVALAHYRASALSGSTQNGSITLTDGGTAQFTISFYSDGTIKFYRGAYNGTLLATYSSAFSATTWDHFQFKIVIDDSVGAIYVRKNGAGSDSFSSTGLDTKATSNAYINGITLLNPTTGGETIIDDLMLYDSSGAVPNDWVGDIRSYALSPSANTAQKDFSGSVFAWTSSVVSTQSRTANTAYFHPYTPTASVTVSAISINVTTGFTGNIKGSVYASDGTSSGPGTLITTINAISNPATGANTLTLAANVDMTANVTYWIALVSDTTHSENYTGVSTVAATKAMTYSNSFASNPAPSLNQTQKTTIDFTAVYQNFYAVNDSAVDGDTSYVYSGTANNVDQYDLSDLPSTPAAIYAVQARLVSRKSDTTTRGAKLQVKSGSTTSESSEVIQSTTYTAINVTHVVDPDTSAAWTASAVNALKLGVKVST